MRPFVLLVFLLTLSVHGDDIRWDKKTFEYKAALKDKGVSFSFVATNSGTKEISLLAGKSSCSCMTLQTDFPLKIAPGQSVTVEAHYSFEGKVGFNQGTLFIEADDKLVYELSVELDIPVSVTVSPRFLIWKKDQKGAQTIAVKLHPDYKGKIISAVLAEPGLGIKADLAKAENGYEITVTPPDNQDLAKKRTWLVLSEEDEDGKKVEHRIYLMFN